MEKKSISLRIDEDILEKIDQYAASRCMSRTQAILSMLSSTQVIVLQEGPEIIRYLCDLDSQLRRKYSLSYDERKIGGICDNLWRLLNSITEKVKRPSENEKI